jgi:hypothetical protein
LNSAIRLASFGFKVTVFEKNQQPVAKLNEIWEGDYRFDKVPSLFTMPHLIEEPATFSDYLKEFKFYKPEVLSNYQFDDDTKFTAPKSIGDFAKELRQNVIFKIKCILKTDFEQLIGEEKILDLFAIKTENASVGGFLFGNASKNRFSAFLNYPAVILKRENCYLFDPKKIQCCLN